MLNSKSLRILTKFSALLCLLAACDKTTTPPPGPPPPPGGSFTVNAVPPATNSSPLSVNGTKPGGHAVLVDGTEQLAADDMTSWTLSLELVEGANSFSLRSSGADGTMTDPVVVQVTLDSVAPEVSETFPAADSTGITLNTEVRAVFTETLDCASVAATTVVLSAGNPVGSSVSCSNQTITLAPDANLAPDTMHRVTILPEVRDAAGNVLAAPFVWSFTTGTEIDNTPPVDPTITSPSPIPGQTFDAQLTVSGTKEAQASVEAQWVLDGSPQGGWLEIFPITEQTDWSYNFPLMNGVNVYTLRSQDSAGNLSCDDAGTPCTTTFTVEKMQMQNMVPTPTVNVINPTTSPWQVLNGTKAADTSIWLDGQMIVPLGPQTTWEYETTLSVGMNNLSITAQDSFGNASVPAATNIMYNALPAIPTNADLDIQFELKDMWAEIGDEYRITDDNREMASYAPIIWLEGPLAWNDNGTPGNTTDDPFESCYFDPGSAERKYVHMANTINWVTYGEPDGSFPDLYGHFWEPNYFIPNYFAALVTAGFWENAGESIPRNVDRRDVNGNTFFWEPGGGACPPMWFRQTSNNNCRPSMSLGPVIDALTEASFHPRFNQQGNPSLGNGQPLGSWTTGLLTYPRRPNDGGNGKPQRRNPGRFWNWRNMQDQQLPQGAYLLTVIFALDRSIPTQQPQWNNVLLSDQETCWDNPNHDLVGSHRAEALVVFGGQDFEIFLDEKGPTNEVVDACTNPREGIRCNNADACDWNGDNNFDNDPACVAPNSAIGSNVRYTVPQQGWPAPVRIRYCPNGCP